jgi:hypothetical protein
MNDEQKKDSDFEDEAEDMTKSETDERTKNKMDDESDIG